MPSDPHCVQLLLIKGARFSENYHINLVINVDALVHCM
jgi:hypothetical protein